MFLYPLLALIAGFAVFYSAGGIFTDEVTVRYSAIAVLAGLDTVLGGWRAYLNGDFDDAVFVTGFFSNVLLAVGLVLLGEKFGLEAGIGDARISIMMIGAVVVFTNRILNNLAAVRHKLIDSWRQKKAGANVPAGPADALPSQ